MSKVVTLNSSPASLVKAMQPGYAFRMVDVVEADFQAINTPQLLTALMAPSVNTHMSKSFIYDQVSEEGQILSGKSYSERGELFTKEQAKQLTFAIPSFGGTFSVLARDYAEKRIPGTNDLMDESYVLGKQLGKVDRAMDLLNELGMASLLVGDTNYVNGGPFTAYDYSNEIRGASRAAALTPDLDALDIIEWRTIVEDAIDKTAEKLGKAGKSASGYVMVAGKNFFNKLYALEAQLGLPRDLKTGSDFASEGMPTITVGEFANFRAFVDSANVMVVKYTANILGSALIGADDAYLVPVGVENMFSIELAPADTREAINKEAQAMYVWTDEDRRGVYYEVESNRLFFNRNPELITAFTES